MSVADYIASLELMQHSSIAYEDLLKAIAQQSLKEKGLADVNIGDVDRDGKIEAKDARAALRVSVGLDVSDFSVIYLGDINNDKDVTAADARLILRASVNLEDSSLWV